MSKELIVPVDNRIADWPRRVANAINYLLRERAALAARVETLETGLATAQTDITTLQGDVADMETAVAALDTRLTAAEADIADHETRIAALETP